MDVQIVQADPRPGLSSAIREGSVTSIKTAELVAYMQDLASPWAETEKAKHQEETRRQVEVTKRAEIDAGVTKLAALLGTVILLAVLGIAYQALKAGKPELAEKLIIALISVGAGYASGRGHAAIKASKAD